MKKGKRKGPMVEVPAGAVYALLAAISIICVTILAVALADDDGTTRKIREEPEVIKTPHLFIEEVFFRSDNTDRITVEVYIYITNDGTKEANGVNVHVWPVVGESNIATDMQEMDFGVIGINETGMKMVSIELKAGETLSVELLVFESNMMILKGRAEVSTSGQGGADYRNTDVRGTDGDGDYDGMPDDWERYYGLDPNDPNDADYDRDGDGITNIMEYRLNRDPTVSPTSDDNIADDDDDETVGWGAASDKDGTTVIFGAGMFLLLIIGVIIVLIIAAARASRKKYSKDPQTEEGKWPPKEGRDHRD
ncbi:MAG: hypothetical protein ACMUIE_06490 [Thermoplasmatota archaeon]